jgi:ATPase family associated with various cellular activities (AAA)
MNRLFNMEHGSVVDSSLAAQVLQRFVSEAEGDVFCQRVQFTVAKSNSLLGIFERVKGLITDGRFVTPTLNGGYGFITGTVDGKPVLIFCRNTERAEYSHDEDEDDGGAYHVYIEVYGAPTCALGLKDRLNKTFSSDKLAKIKWWYMSDGRCQQHTFYLPPPDTKLHAEYYPDMGDPAKFIEGYLESNSSVLLLAGPPGTGKTTLLRHMISERNLTAHVIYDEKLMDKDNIFQTFLFEKDSDVLIIEDADTILMPRESDGNKLMARFLSISDGLIKLPNKKLIFTTNLSDFDKVDKALLRPGRCHAVVHTRPLNLAEAQAAAKVADVPVPTQKGEYTIAELFNQGFRPAQRNIGFGARH